MTQAVQYFEIACEGGREGGREGGKDGIGFAKIEIGRRLGLTKGEWHVGREEVLEDHVGSKAIYPGVDRLGRTWRKEGGREGGRE